MWPLLCVATVTKCLLTDILYCIVLCVTWRLLNSHVTLIVYGHCDKVPSGRHFLLHCVVCYVKFAKLSCDTFCVGPLFHSDFWHTGCTALCYSVLWKYCTHSTHSTAHIQHKSLYTYGTKHCLHTAQNIAHIQHKTLQTYSTKHCSPTTQYLSLLPNSAAKFAFSNIIR